MKIWNALLISLVHFSSSAQNTLGPHLTALGGNGIAVRDVWAIQGNASAITDVEKATVSVAYIKHLFSNEISTQAAVFVLPLDNNFVGAGYQQYGFSGYTESKATFAYSRKFGPHLSIAIKGNYHQVKIPEYGSATAFSIDAGALYKVDKFAFGVLISNPSRQKFVQSQVSSGIPTSVSVGATYFASDKVLIAGYFVRDIQKIADAGLGLEYKIMSILRLRGGFSVRQVKQYAGFGLNFNKLNIDMATAYDANLGYTPQIGLGYAF
ncbi:type IX secretion system membrane protein PorP/SprF [Pedobacter frigidisoli]|uniref:type IX secretion system membrane protein PorP/SprF n=1 Tax=Pedobacter frigidisoli TaxID=2530455 RepID=UPI0029306371|nr:type IX secretion system membrane protein PorP/SprF [Pedobacter frigidisoli]